MLFTVFFSIMILIGSACDKDVSTDVEQNLIVCIDTHSQPPYPEQGRNVDLPSIIQAMDDNDVSWSILSARVEMQYSESEWNTLFIDHPERFVFAFDRVFPNQWTHYNEDMTYFRNKISNLPNSVAKAIAYDNAMVLFNL